MDIIIPIGWREQERCINQVIPPKEKNLPESCENCEKCIPSSENKKCPAFFGVIVWVKVSD
jgi:hypothetical protein